MNGAGRIALSAKADGVTGATGKQNTAKASITQITALPEHSDTTGKVECRTAPSGTMATGAGQQPVFTVTDNAQTANSSAAPTTPPHPAVMQAAHQIVTQATLLHNGQATEMQLRLRPPELGDVQVTLRRDANGVISAHLIPATREAGAIINANLHHLRQSLDRQSAGGQAQVSVGHRDAADHHQHANRGQRSHEDDASSTAAPQTTANDAQTPADTRRSHRIEQTGVTVDYDA